MISRTDILRKSHYGLKLISMLLHRLYPDVVVMHLSGRDAGMCPNPWDEGRLSLHVWIDRIHPDVSLSLEISRFHDESGNVPDGDCFDFAALMTGLKDQALLEWIDREMFLHIVEPVVWYPQRDKVRRVQNDATAYTTETAFSTDVPVPMFSFFKAPVRNTIPYRDIGPAQAWAYMTGPYAKHATETLRSIRERDEARRFKAVHFCYACFSGTFRRRSDAEIKAFSELMCLDFDHLEDVAALRSRLIADRELETVLLFRSPSGDGIKWVVRIAYCGHTHGEVFRAVSNYIFSTYGVRVDPSGKDVSRACFLPYDPEAYLAPKYNIAI